MIQESKALYVLYVHKWFPWRQYGIEVYSPCTVCSREDRVTQAKPRHLVAICMPQLRLSYFAYVLVWQPKLWRLRLKHFVTHLYIMRSWQYVGFNAWDIDPISVMGKSCNQWGTPTGELKPKIAPAAPSNRSVQQSQAAHYATLIAAR